MQPIDFTQMYADLESMVKKKPEASGIAGRVRQIGEQVVTAQKSDTLQVREQALAQISREVAGLDPKTVETIIDKARTALGIKGEKRTREEEVSEEVSGVPVTKSEKAEDVCSTTFEALRSKTKGGYVTVNPEISGLKHHDRGLFTVLSGDSDKAQLAKVLTDDTMIAGMRRCFLGQILERSDLKRQIQDEIGSGLMLLLEGQMAPEAIKDIVQRIVGDVPRSRTVSTNLGNAQQLFTHPNAIEDIRSMLKAADHVTDRSSAIGIVQELFCYSLPEQYPEGNIDDALRQGVIILMNKGLTVPDLFEAFRKGYPTGTLDGVIIKRFIPLFLTSLPMVENPFLRLKELTGILETILGQTEEAKNLVLAVKDFVGKIAQNTQSKNRDLDTCLVGVPLLLSVTGGFPDRVSDAPTECVRLFSGALQSGIAAKAEKHEVKGGLPGLRAFGVLVQSSTADIPGLFNLRPTAFRTGNEMSDRALFLHHMIQAAEYATDAVASQVVIEKTLTELSKVIDPAYQVVVNDLLALLHNLTLLSTPMREKILEIWNQLVSKDEIQPSIAPQIAGQMVLKAVFAAANEGVNPAVVLGGCTTIHLALTGFKLDSVVSPLISLLTSVHGTRVEATIVNNFIIPLLNDIFTGNVGPDQQEEVCSRLLDVQYLLQWDETQVELHRSLSNRPFSLNSAEIQRIRQERVNALFREARTNPSPARVLAASPVLAKELGGPAYQAFYEFLQVVLTQLQNRPVGEQGPIVGNIIIPLLQRIIPIVSGTEALDPAHGIRILSDLVFLVPSLGAWGVSTAPIDLEKLGCATADFSANTSALARIVVDRLKQVEKFISDEVGRRKLTGGPADEVVCQTGFLEWLGRILTFVQQGRLNVEILDRAHDVFCAEGGPLMREIIPAVKRAPKTTYSSTLQAAGIPDILSQW